MQLLILKNNTFLWIIDKGLFVIIITKIEGEKRAFLSKYLTRKCTFLKVREAYDSDAVFHEPLKLLWILGQIKVENQGFFALRTAVCTSA